MRLSFIALCLFLLCGCATLRDIAEQPAEFITEATPTVAATNVLLGGLGIPAGVGVALGYILHIARIIYKKRKGSKFSG